MIIKSMGRRKSTVKGQTLFATLLSYMLNEEGVDIDLLHNLPHGIDRDAIADAFQKNANLLFERKGGNIAYHEILSLPANDHDRERVKAALCEIGQMYLDERAPENIALGVIHAEKAHLHLHIMLSSNRLMDRKRLRLSKKDFLMVQEKVASRAGELFPELQLDNLYTPDRVHSHTRERVRLSQGQQHEHQHGKDRPKNPSRKVELSSLLHGLLVQHQDKASLDVALKRHGLAIYQRGNTRGLGSNGTANRLRDFQRAGEVAATLHELLNHEHQKSTYLTYLYVDGYKGKV